MIKRIRQAVFLEGSECPHVWSVRFDPDSDSPVGIRADSAMGMVAEVAVGGERVRNDFDEISIFNRPLFNATWDDTQNRWVDLVEYGEAGFTLYPTEAGREVVYRSTPFWYQLELSDTGRICRVSVSEVAVAGYKLAPMFRDGNTPVYRSAFETVIDYMGDELPHSRAGFEPAENDPYNWREIMGMRGERARSESGAEWFSDYLLLLVEFATLNLQSVLHGVCGEQIVLFNGNEVNDICPVGLYTNDTHSYTKGDRILLLADDGMGEYLRYGEYVITKIDPYEGVGERISLSGLNIDDLMMETVAWLAIPARARTGEAISAVTRATSGRANSRPMAPIVWRGKENPWGNTSVILSDYALKIKRGGNAQLYRMNSDRFSNFLYELKYQSCGEEYPLPYLDDSFVMSMANSPAEDFLYPVLFDDTALDRYFTTRCSIYGRNNSRDLFCAITVGGDNAKSIGTNFATMEFISPDALSSKWSYIGSRLAFKEG